ncbi:hypothetical protein EG328_000858 [Venturia inaequalis]|uniref:Uncharacterized protein n=1 Tax=Venturia inaequalis TaxID=5025 RepID=A0A8H3V1Q3_VENIN|nr:hypothetical protein EG328_000858 [Venturia inaequalis]
MTKVPLPNATNRKPSTKPRESTQDAAKPRKPPRPIDSNPRTGLTNMIQGSSRLPSENVPDGLTVPHRRPSRQLSESVRGGTSRGSSGLVGGGVGLAGTADQRRDERQRSLSVIEDVSVGPVEDGDALVEDGDEVDPLAVPPRVSVPEQLRPSRIEKGDPAAPRRRPRPPVPDPTKEATLPRRKPELENPEASERVPRGRTGSRLGSRTGPDEAPARIRPAPDRTASVRERITDDKDSPSESSDDGATSPKGVEETDRREKGVEKMARESDDHVSYGGKDDDGLGERGDVVAQNEGVDKRVDPDDVNDVDEEMNDPPEALNQPQTIENDPETDANDNNNGEVSQKMDIDQTQTTQAKGKRKLVEDPADPTTKKPQTKRTKNNADPPGEPMFTQQETNDLGRASELFVGVLGSVMRRNAEAGARDGILAARAAIGANGQRKIPAAAKAGPATQDVNDGGNASAGGSVAPQVAPKAPVKGKKDGPSKTCKGCEEPYSIKNPAARCALTGCRNRRFCTECKDVHNRGFRHEETGLWFDSAKCRDKHPVVQKAEAKRKEEEDGERKKKEDEETAKLAAREKQVLEASEDLRKAKKEAKEKKDRDAAKKQEEADAEIEELEEEIAAAGPAGKITDPLTERCQKCTKVWGGKVAHAECQFDGCEGHSLCETCKGTARATKNFTGGWTVDKPYVWYCSFRCRKGWYDDLDEDEKAGRRPENGELS